MFGRNKKPEIEQGREGRLVRQSGTSSPAFSYYNSRSQEVRTERRQVARERTERQEPKESREGRKSSWTTQLPFWLLVIVFAVCVSKILLLSTYPKVIVVGKSSTAANYLQPNQVYAEAGQKQLQKSILNRTKLTVNLTGTAAALKRQFPELQIVSLDVPLVGTRPIVYVQVAQPTIVIQTANGNYALNESGIVLTKLRTVPSNVPLIVDQSGSQPKPGVQFLPGSTVSFVSTVAYQFGNAKIDTSTFVLPAGAPYELDVRPAGESYRVRMNLMADARLQSGAAIATIEQLGSNNPTEYLDVRTPDRVYYK